jgi:phosphoglycerol transferase MdoB-like AlkP superfamily enzyme
MTDLAGRLRQARDGERVVLCALLVAGHLFACRLLIAHYEHFPPLPWRPATVLDAILGFGPDALAVAALFVCLALGRLSSVAAAVLMVAGAGYLMVLASVNVAIMRVYGQPPTVNLFGYGDFVHVEGLASLVRYTTRWERVLLGLALLLTAVIAAMPWLGRARVFHHRWTRSLTLAAALVVFPALPVLGMVTGEFAQPRTANAGWHLAQSAIASGNDFARVDHPDMRDPFETYATPAIASREQVKTAGIRNVLIVVLESVGSEYLDLDRNPGLTPNIARLRDEAAYFPNTYAGMPSSPMSLFSLMSGMYAPVSPRALPMVEPEFPAPTLLGELREAGKRTGVFSANWGFMDFGRYLKGRVDHLEQMPDQRTCRGPAPTGEGRGRIVSGGAEPCTFAELQRWIAQSDQPFAALLWTYQTHYPYELDPAVVAADPALAKSRYLAAITRSDALIGGVMDSLRRQGRLDNTLVVILGDHGEAFHQHGTQAHGDDVYRESIRVPLLLVNPRLFSGMTDRTPVRLIDVPSTILSLAGQAVPTTMQGIDLTGPLRPRRVFFSAAWLNLVMGYQEGARKYDYFYVTDHLQAFDLSRDPHEMNDLGGQLAAPERAAVIHRLMNWKAAVDAKTQAVRSRYRQR